MPYSFLGLLKQRRTVGTGSRRRGKGKEEGTRNRSRKAKKKSEVSPSLSLRIPSKTVRFKLALGPLLSVGSWRPKNRPQWRQEWHSCGSPHRTKPARIACVTDLVRGRWAKTGTETRRHKSPDTTSHQTGPQEMPKVIPNSVKHPQFHAPPNPIEEPSPLVSGNEPQMQAGGTTTPDG